MMNRDKKKGRKNIFLPELWVCTGKLFQTRLLNSDSIYNYHAIQYNYFEINTIHVKPCILSLHKRQGKRYILTFLFTRGSFKIKIQHVLQIFKRQGESKKPLREFKRDRKSFLLCTR